MGVISRFAVRPFEFFPRALPGAVCLSALLGTGCGVELEAPRDEGTIRTERQALMGGGWRDFLALPSQSGGFAGDSAVCDAYTFQGGFVAFGRSAETGRFRMSITERLIPATAWADVGTQQFNAKPGCAPLDGVYDLPQSQWSYQKAIVGKSNFTNQYLIRIQKLGPSSPIVPETIQNWTSISSSTYSSAPAVVLSTHLISGPRRGRLAVVGRRSNGRLYVHLNELNDANPGQPFSNSNWQPAAQAPALPSGWSAQGDPAVVDGSIIWNAITIMTRATSGSQTRLYGIFWYGPTYGFGSWVNMSTLTSGADPAISWWNYPLQTVFVRGSGGAIYEADGLGPGIDPFTALVNDNNSGFVGAPSAAGNLTSWEGNHVVVARRSDNQFYWASPCLIPWEFC
jgi:hypothetical protein